MERDGHALVSSNTLPGAERMSTFPIAIISRRKRAATPALMSAACIGRALPGISTYFFALSQRRPSTDGKFNGIISIAVLPSYFEEFYARMGSSRGQLFRLGARRRRLSRALPAAERPPAQARRPQRSFCVSIRAGPRSRHLHVSMRSSTASSAASAIASSPAFRSMSLAGVEQSRDRRRMADLHEQPPDLRPAGDAFLFVGLWAGAAAHASGSTTKPTGARRRKARCARRSGWRRSAN